ncbi:pilus assembly protein CpaE [Bordetella avium]|uniref:pilus assembly protein CpaE n=1 Tax=Bordetella avium TaxID=521 RepID=UPI00057B3AB3|nr:pilus assembly protein CpaE [Bordetella avium]AZY53228.1 pilus assembly protein CpaE [Bordetella avium]RIQ13150.1 pilus assembly protein CpaE [Bordetella avium]RIQ17246.1 pilus assembly protein CpaE [Bordetella avium]RIQ33730.1 pilus assembly protein CpaE [Bordetella avium]RIQ37715.1 pilus assembly protein CpaE [Bordetella avium]
MNDMKTHAWEWGGLDKATCFLFCSSDYDVAQQLGQAVGDLGLLTQELPSLDVLAQRLAEINPQVVFLDFTGGQAEPGKLLLAADMARVLMRVAPSLPRVAVGYLSQPDGAIAALRAGVSDFVDPSVSPDEIRAVVQRLITDRRQTGGEGPQRSILLLGARPGVGTSTLAVHVAGLAQQHLAHLAQARQGGKGAAKSEVLAAQLPLNERVCVLDLGWPIGDCLLYLNINSDFDFAEATRNLPRLDGTLLSSAMAHTAAGISAMALPRDTTQVRSLSPADSLSLFERLRQHYGLLVTDAGGFSNPDFVAKLARSSQEVWLVTDQSVSALVSLANILQELAQQHVQRDRLKLIVNRYDERYGMTSEQIAERFGVVLGGTLPDRTLPLMLCTNQGRLLYQQADRDIYVRGVQGLVDRVLAERTASGPGRNSWLAAWLPGVHKRMILP